jgi:hypothetical protein
MALSSAGSLQGVTTLTHRVPKAVTDHLTREGHRESPSEEGYSPVLDLSADKRQVVGIQPWRGFNGEVSEQVGFSICSMPSISLNPMAKGRTIPPRAALCRSAGKGCYMDSKVAVGSNAGHFKILFLERAYNTACAGGGGTRPFVVTKRNGFVLPSVVMYWYNL